MSDWLDDLLYKSSKRIMLYGRTSQIDPGHLTENSSGDIRYRKNESPEGEAQATYLLPRSLLRKYFLKAGYIDGTPGDYGLVKKAVGNRNIPVFLTAPDAISRDLLTVIGNPPSFDYMIDVPYKTQLAHAGSYPSALYTDKDGNLFRKDWDLNDYGDSSGGDGVRYKDLWMANLIDRIGSPVVVTTGFLPAYNMNYSTEDEVDLYKPIRATLYNSYNDSPIVREYIKNLGLIPYYGDYFNDERDFEQDENYGYKEEDNGEYSFLDRNPIAFTLPEVTVTKKK